MGWIYYKFLYYMANWQGAVLGTILGFSSIAWYEVHLRVLFLFVSVLALTVNLVINIKKFKKEK